METMVLMRTYLRNLIRADASIHTGITNRVFFNDCPSPGNFNSCLFSEEIMIVKKLCEIGELAQSNPYICRLLTKYLNHLSRLFLQEPQGEWTHLYLYVIRDDKQIATGPLCKTIRKQIGEYVKCQYEAFQRVCDILLPFLPGKTDDYKMNLDPTEFIELSLIFQASGRMECIDKQFSQIGMARYLAKVLGVVFPNNYNSLKAQLLERNRSTVFWDFLHSSFITYLRNRK